MGKPIKFSISFPGNEQRIFFPGQTLNGFVNINNNSPMKMRAVKIRFFGKAYVYWTESERRRRTHRTSGSAQTGRRTYYYRASENYFNYEVSLYGKGSGGMSETATELAAGQHSFAFSFELPMNLPSSFEGKFGYVRYCVKSNIDRPWRFDHNTKVAFTVLDLLDLNQDPSARVPRTNSDSRTLCCLCCASGPIQVQVHLDRGGYVPGEYILINASIENFSNRKLPSCKATLIQTVTFCSSSKSKTVAREVATIVGPGCDHQKTVDWNNERLQIPPIPPSHLLFCDIINIEYSLQFTAVLPMGSKNLKVLSPVIIGSVPLEGLTPYALPSTNPPMEPSALATPETFQPPPPSYAATIGKPVNIADEDDNKHLMGQTQYTPQYAYYDWSQSAFFYANNQS